MEKRVDIDKDELLKKLKERELEKLKLAIERRDNSDWEKWGKYVFGSALTIPLMVRVFSKLPWPELSTVLDVTYLVMFTVGLIIMFYKKRMKL